MRVDVALHGEGITIVRECAFPTRGDAERLVPEVVEHTRDMLVNTFLLTLDRWDAQSLSLIPHPDEYQGPEDPDWARMMERLHIEALTNRVRDWIDGYHCALRRSAPWLTLSLTSALTSDQLLRNPHFRCDYAFVRDVLLERGHDPAVAQRVALAATAPPHRYLDDVAPPKL